MANDRLCLAGGGDSEPRIGARDAEVAATRGFAGGLTSSKVGIREQIHLKALHAIADPVNLAPVVSGVDVVHQSFEFDVTFETPPVAESCKLLPARSRSFLAALAP